MDTVEQSLQETTGESQYLPPSHVDPPALARVSKTPSGALPGDLPHKSSLIIHKPAATGTAVNPRHAGVRFAAEINEQLQISTAPSASSPTSHPSPVSRAVLLRDASVSSSSGSLFRPMSTTSTYNTSPATTPPHHISSTGISSSPELLSPPSSAFVSASASPISSPARSLIIVDLPPEIELDQQAPQATAPPQPPPNLQQSTTFAGRTSPHIAFDDTFLELQFVRPSSAGYEQSFTRGQQLHQLQLYPTASSTSPPTDSDRVPHIGPGEFRPPPIPIISTSPSASFRPRTCDVYIGIHGFTSSLSRFSKWLRAELEFQGIACFLADRAGYTDPRIHDIARHIMQSCTFGVIVINKKTFKNLYSVEELQIFQERKNLVPLFFDIAQSDCMARDIVERRGEAWEKEGGDLWRAFGGKEREWREAVDGLSRIEEWKLEAFNGNWRDCILRAVSLLGTRIGRRSVAERARVRKQRVEKDEFPFPRNIHFVGREKELSALGKLLFGNGDEESSRHQLHELSMEQLIKQDHCNINLIQVRNRLDESCRTQVPSGRIQITTSQSERWPSRRHADLQLDAHGHLVENRRRSDADSWHYSRRALMQENDKEYVGRRKSDSDRWPSLVAGGRGGRVAAEFGGIEANEAWHTSKDNGGQIITSLVLPGSIMQRPPISEIELERPTAQQFGRRKPLTHKGGMEILEHHHHQQQLVTNQGTRSAVKVRPMSSSRSEGKVQRSSANSTSGRRRKGAGKLIESTTSTSMAEEDGDGESARRGIAWVCGAAGIGKTEVALEFAYRFSQRYRMVLWIGGETRYLRQNYLNLSALLGLDVGTESQVGPERGRVRTFEEQEREALQRVRRELERDVPYLLIIDNLESERDWWDRKEVAELLPRPGGAGATHVIVTTRLSKFATIPKAVKLLYLSGVEAISLMRGKRELSAQELDALKEMEERLERSTFGLGLVGKLLAELPSLMPSVLLEKVNKGFPDYSLTSGGANLREDAAVKGNSFLLILLGVCFSFLEQLGGPRKLAYRMACIGGWCAPFPIPILLLGAATLELPEQSSTSRVARVFRDSVLFCGTTQTRRGESEAGHLLVRLGLARSCSRQGWVLFDEIVQLYARKKGGVPAARAMVQGIKKRGVISQHSEHFWAACFLVFGFANDPIVVDLRAVELLSFIKKGALQVAFRAFTTYSRCRAALELLRLCTNMLEDVEKSFVSQSQDWTWGRSLCWRASSSTLHNYNSMNRSNIDEAQAASAAGVMQRRPPHAGGSQEVDEYVWEEATLLKASLLETRAKLLLKGGQFDAGEEICRTCICIRTVMLGEHHPDTISAQETLAKLVRCRSST